MQRLRVDRLSGATRRVEVGGRAVVAPCHVATSPLSRAVGLLGTRHLGPGEGLWLEPCASVHTAFLRVPIGCVFVDAHGVVLRVADPLPRWRVAGARGARAVVEAPAGTFAGVRPGDVVTTTPWTAGDPAAEG